MRIAGFAGERSPENKSRNNQPSNDYICKLADAFDARKVPQREAKEVLAPTDNMGRDIVEASSKGRAL